MSARSRSAAALDVIDDYLRELAGGGAASRALIRQRGWALREAVLFAAAQAQAGSEVAAGVPLSPEARAALDLGVTRVRLEALLSDGFAGAWVAQADPVLRGVPGAVPATQRARMASLRALAAFVEAEIPAHQAGRPVLRDLLTEPQLASALQALTRRLPGRGPDDQVRLGAILAVMSVWPVRSADLAAMRVSQVRDRGREVVLEVPAVAGAALPEAAAAGSGPGTAVAPGTGPGEEEAARLVLSGTAGARMREWIAVRAALVSALQGGPVRTLWVSIRSNSRPGGPHGSLPLPAGLPLRPRGLQRAYARSVSAANVVYDGLPGFPLPRSLDLLRRSLLSTQPGSR